MISNFNFQIDHSEVVFHWDVKSVLSFLLFSKKGKWVGRPNEKKKILLISSLAKKRSVGPVKRLFKLVSPKSFSSSLINIANTAKKVFSIVLQRWHPVPGNVVRLFISPLFPLNNKAWDLTVRKNANYWENSCINFLFSRFSHIMWSS